MLGLALSATCPPGKRATGGGASTFDVFAAEALQPTLSTSSPRGTEWLGIAAKPSGGNYNLQVYVICATVAK